jgi:malonyl-CoA/methylmalonyl-CoA synthetase
MNFFNSIENILSSNSKRELITTVDGSVYSRSDILEKTGRVANFLYSLGAKPGDRISVQVHKSIENMCIYLACLRGGLVFHPLNPSYTANEVKYFLENAKPFVIICDPSKFDMMRKLSEPTDIKHIYTLDSHGNGQFSEATNLCSPNFNTVSREKDDLAALLYSSGTTGLPKGIMLTHTNLLTNAECLVEYWGFSEKDRLLHVLPIFHVHGLFVALNCILLTGGTMRWADKFTPNYVNQYLSECTVMMGVPTYYTRLLSDAGFGIKHTQNMRLFTSGSAPLLVDTFNDFRDRSGFEILERYGMTETGMNCSNPLNRLRKPGTVGPPLPGVTARIVNASGKNVCANEVGDLQVKGDNVFKGYWEMPEKTKEDFTIDGFFNTGDQATLDNDGYVSIVGRSKDMIISGGLNVYPKEVEDILDEFKGIQESAVFGVDHADLGEAVVAVIVLSEGGNIDLDNVINYSKEKLANYKVPKHIEVISNLPRNTMGKVQKKVLRSSYKSIF